MGSSGESPRSGRAGRVEVRFSPPVPGEYKYHAESTDKSNPDLNGHEGSLRVEPYRGLERAAHAWTSQSQQNHHYFEYADVTPFLWLGDTWWKGLCRRISLDGFKTLAADRHEKGFNVVRDRGRPLSRRPPFDDRGKNEGGFVWGAGFHADRPQRTSMRLTREFRYS